MLLKLLKMSLKLLISLKNTENCQYFDYFAQLKLQIYFWKIDKICPYTLFLPYESTDLKVILKVILPQKPFI